MSATVDLAAVVSPDGSAVIDGGTITPAGDGEATVVLSNAGPFDDATTYSLDVDYADADGATFTLFSLLDPSPEGWAASQRHALGSPTVADGAGTLSFDIGPSLSGWSDAVADGERYLGLAFTAATISAVESSPDLEDIDGDDDEDVDPEPAPDGYIPPVLRDVALAFDNLTTVDGRVAYDVLSADMNRHVDQIVVDGEDVTWWGRTDSPHQTPDFELVLPGSYGPGSWTIEGLNLYLMDRPAWLHEGARVRINRRNAATGAWVATDWRGFIADIICQGNDTVVTLGGDLSGRASLQHRPASPWTRVRDLGFMVADAATAAGVKFSPRAGIETGIELIPGGGEDRWAYITEILAQAQKRSGVSWTIAREDGAYRMVERDLTTVHGTWYTDGTGVSMATSLAEKPNRVFGRAVTDEGMIINGMVVPGANPQDPPPFPGTLELGDSGADVRILAGKLAAVGLLSRSDLFDEEGADTFDEDLEDAVKQLQKRAGLTRTGVVNSATWDAAWDLATVRPTLDQTRILPLAYDDRTEKWLRSADGTTIGLSPDYDPDVMPVEVHKDMGLVKGERQAVRWAQGELADDEEWTGDWQNGPLALGVIEGDHDMGDPIPGILRARGIRPGMNIKNGVTGVLYHVTGIQWTRGESATFTLSTKPMDSMEAWEIARRNRESRAESSRRHWKDLRRSRSVQDLSTEWTPEMGRVIETQLAPGPNVLRVVVGQRGTIERVRVQIDPGTEFALAVFEGEVTTDFLNGLDGDPLVAGDDWAYKKANRLALKDKGLLYATSTPSQPAGYGYGMKYHPETGALTGDEPDGLLVDHAPVEFSVPIWRPWVNVAIWLPVAAPGGVLQAGRMFRVSPKAGL